MALVTLELFAWRNAVEFHRWQQEISFAWYGVPSQVAPLYLKVDAHIHLLTMGSLLAWMSWSRRLWNLPLPWWSPLLAGALIAVGDETCQALSRSRAFEWEDLACDGISLLVVGVIDAWIHRRNVRRARKTSTDVIR